METIKLTQSERAVGHAASTDKGRPTLTALYFADGKIAADDGYMLAVREVENVPTEGSGVMLDAKALVGAKNIGKEFPYVMVDLPDGDKSGATVTIQDFAKLPLTPIAGDFPDYMKLFSQAPVRATIALSPKMLRKLLAVAGDAHRITFQVRSDTEPLEFHCDDGNDEGTYGLVMPMMLPERHRPTSPAP